MSLQARLIPMKRTSGAHLKRAPAPPLPKRPKIQKNFKGNDVDRAIEQWELDLSKMIKMNKPSRDEKKRWIKEDLESLKTNLRKMDTDITDTKYKETGRKGAERMKFFRYRRKIAMKTISLKVSGKFYADLCKTMNETFLIRAGTGTHKSDFNAFVTGIIKDAAKAKAKAEEKKIAEGKKKQEELQKGRVAIKILKPGAPDRWDAIRNPKQKSVHKGAKPTLKADKAKMPTKGSLNKLLLALKKKKTNFKKMSHLLTSINGELKRLQGREFQKFLKTTITDNRELCVELMKDKNKRALNALKNGLGAMKQGSIAAALSVSK